MIPRQIPFTDADGKQIPSAIVELATVLLNLSFSDNFKGFTAEVSLPTLTEVTIPNQLRLGGKLVIPTKRLLLRETGPGQIVDGSTAWTTENLYLYNAGASTATATVLFLL